VAPSSIFPRSKSVLYPTFSVSKLEYPRIIHSSLFFKMEDSEHRRGHLDETAIPGTVHLVDLEGTIRAKHASGAQLKDVVLVPAPSADPDDPLNWSPRRKWLSTASQSIYTLMVGIASAAIYSVLVPISEDTGLTLGDLNAGTGYVPRMDIEKPRLT
jgi:hypothetical protein